MFILIFLHLFTFQTPIIYNPLMKLTSCWIDKQERPLCFQISSFTSSRIKTEEEKVRPS